MDNRRETELLYTTYKTVMLGVAYRMLGSVTDAEDIVHDVFLRLNTEALHNVQNIKAYLCKIVTNRCLDRLRATSTQREVYVGPWLPEPLVDDAVADPSLAYEDKEQISTAFFLLLQQLSWSERAVFVLREVLQFDYTDIAEIVGKSPANCRQIYHRAKRSLGTIGDASGGGVDDLGMETDRRRRYEQAQTVVRQFADALIAGNLQALVDILSLDVTAYTDGGGRVKAAILPIQGVGRVSRFLAGILAKAPGQFAYRHTVVNGLPGIVTYEGKTVSTVVSFRLDNGRITDIYAVTNPDKLKHVK